MGRPRIRKPDELRFKKGDRVVWKSGNAWKSGEVIASGKTREEAIAQIPAGYQMATTKEEAKGPFYYVAADTPLFRPGFSLYSIREKHLQKETESWEYRREQLLRLTKPQWMEVVLAAAQIVHDKKKKAPLELRKALHNAAPDAFPNPNA